MYVSNYVAFQNPPKTFNFSSFLNIYTVFPLYLAICSRAGLSIPEALGKLSIGGPPQVEDAKKKSSPPQIVEFECISDQNIV